MKPRSGPLDVRPPALDLALPSGAGTAIVRVLSIGLLGSVVPLLYVLLQDGEGRLPGYAAFVFLFYGLACWPLYRAVTMRLRRERVRLAVREAGLVDADSLIAIARDLPSLGELPRMASRLTSALREAFGAESTALLVADPQSGQLQALVSRPDDAKPARELPVLLPKRDPGLVLLKRAGHSMEVEELRHTSPELDRHLNALDARLLVPLVRQHDLVGVLVLGPPSGVSVYTHAQREILDLLAHHVSTIIENARLFASATFDSLTGLMRREVGLDRLVEEVERADRYARPMSVCLIDLDRFKQVNDRLGHLAGDIVLRRVATEISDSLRASDCACRYGGEEFLVVLPEAELDQAIMAAEKLRRRIATLTIDVNVSTSIEVRVSIGVASLESVDQDALSADGFDAMAVAEALIEAADRALYDAKEGGRDRVEPDLILAREDQAREDQGREDQGREDHGVVSEPALR